MMTIEKKINKLIDKIDRLMIEFAHAVPDDKLPLVNMNGLNDKAKLIIENRLKGFNPRPCKKRPSKII